MIFEADDEQRKLERAIAAGDTSLRAKLAAARRRAGEESSRGLSEAIKIVAKANENDSEFRYMIVADYDRLLDNSPYLFRLVRINRAREDRWAQKNRHRWKYGYNRKFEEPLTDFMLSDELLREIKSLLGT